MCHLLKCSETLLKVRTKKSIDEDDIVVFDPLANTALQDDRKLKQTTQIKHVSPSRVRVREHGDDK